MVQNGLELLPTDQCLARKPPYSVAAEKSGHFFLPAATESERIVCAHGWIVAEPAQVVVESDDVRGGRGSQRGGELLMDVGRLQLL